MNVTNFIGRLGRDWELKYSGGGNAYAKNSLAVRRSFKDKQSGEYETDWVPITAFGKTAETLANYTNKGSSLGVEGSLQVTQTQNEAGENRTYYDVIINKFHFISGDQQQSQQNGQVQQQTQQQPAMNQSFNQPINTNNQATNQPINQQQQQQQPMQQQPNNAFANVSDQVDIGDELPF